MKRFLLDTGMLLGLTRKAPWARRTLDRVHLDDQETATFTSVICHGELLALAEKNGWGERRRTELASTLAKVPTLDINKQAILNAYALIDAWTHGKSVTAPHNVSPPEPAISMGKNDMQRFYVRFHSPESALVGWTDDAPAAQEHPYPGVETGTLNGWNWSVEPAKMRP